MEGDFLLQRIQQEGERANRDFESRLKASLPLKVLLEVEDSDEELKKMLDDMHRRYADDEKNPWTSETFTPADVPIPTLAELETRYSENPWMSKAAQQEPAAEPEREEEIEVPPDRADRHTRYVENMKSAILFKMQEEHMTRDAAVSEMLRIAGANTFSRQIIREAEQQTVNA